MLLGVALISSFHHPVFRPLHLPAMYSCLLSPTWPVLVWKPLKLSLSTSESSEGFPVPNNASFCPLEMALTFVSFTLLHSYSTIN